MEDMQINWNIWLDTVLPLITAFALTTISGKFFIPFLTRIKAGQTERDDGPKSHLSKSGTPNMGGLMIMLGFIAACIICSVRAPEVIPVMILTAGFAVVGFLDDYIKVILKRSKGLSVWQKLVLQIIIVLFFVWYIRHFHNINLSMKIPFAEGSFLNFGIMSIPFMLFVIVATVNGTNFNDGVDGMASCVTIAVAVFFTVAALITGTKVAPAGAAMIGALLGFLIYNSYPAKIFMGDTGALALGGFVSGMAYIMQMPLYIPFIGFIYLLEVVSVILQVLYFKKTGGKRLFRMAPIHHHFELGGYSEVQVVALFTIITILIGTVMLPAIW